jgi:TolB-like protein
MKSLLCFAIALSTFFVVFSQPTEKIDVVFKANGDQLKGQVVEVNDDNIRFKYTGEQVIYTFKKSEIQKVTFSSGRTETYNNTTSPSSNSSAPVQNAVPTAPAAAQSSAEERRNKIAILPFSFIKDGQNLPQEASDEVQEECFTRLSEHSGTYTVISPRATNVILAKAGIDKSNIVKYTMAEICQILGVQYVVDGLVNQTNTSQSSSGNKSYDFKKNDGKSNNDKMSGSSSYSSNVSQNYETFTTINMYNDKSEMIFSQRKKALFSTVGAYKSSIGYLLKRSPLYTK